MNLSKGESITPKTKQIFHGNSVSFLVGDGVARVPPPTMLAWRVQIQYLLALQSIRSPRVTQKQAGREFLSACVQQT